MKILICSIYLPSGNDGVSSSTRQLVWALERQGAEVSVFTTDWGWSSADLVEHRSDKMRVFKAVLNNNFDFSYGLIRELKKIRRGDFDLVQLNSIYSVSTVFGARFCRKNRLPYVVAPHGNFIPSLGNQNQQIRSVWKKRLFFELFSRRVLRNADKIICNSELEMKSLGNKLKTANLAFIGNGIDCAAVAETADCGIIETELGIKTGTPVFLFLGRLAEEKAIPFLLELWDVLVKKMPEATLVICGESIRDSLRKFREQVRNLARPENVIMPGPVTGELKQALLHHSRCLLLPSHFESFGYVVLEALGSGIPVVASRGTPWSVLEEKRLGRWLPRDIQTWVDALVALDREESFHDENFSAYSRKWVEDNFSWRTLAGKYLNLYEDIVKHHRD
ncbi:MAG: glycosyltransferase family 4 protein [Victivallaceae bacterium]|nr:glycosyltransferase family 4 protein [Victivallaceae bacterium]